MHNTVWWGNKSVSKTEIPPYGLKPHAIQNACRGSCPIPNPLRSVGACRSANSECPAEPRQPTSLAASVSSQVKFIFPGNFCIYASGGAAGAAPWPNFTKRGNDCPDSRTTCVQNFTPLALSAVEKSVTVQRSKKNTVN